MSQIRAILDLIKVLESWELFQTFQTFRISAFQCLEMDEHVEVELVHFQTFGELESLEDMRVPLRPL